MLSLASDASMQTTATGLTSWRMSSSLGMMDSSRVSSLRRQDRGLGKGVWENRVPSPLGPRGRVGWELLWKEEGRGCSPILDQSYDLGVGLPDDTLPIHLHKPISCGQGVGTW